LIEAVAVAPMTEVSAVKALRFKLFVVPFVTLTRNEARPSNPARLRVTSFGLNSAVTLEVILGSLCAIALEAATAKAATRTDLIE
jgi:hypothetical protein